MEVKNKDVKDRDVKKILVKFPRSRNEVFSSFPFLITLSEEFPKAEINVVVEENCSLAFSFLPFKVKAFERAKHQMSWGGTHKFCANLNDVFNIDLFLDLENSLNSAFMGFNFRAKERVGYAIDWNKYFLNKKFENVENFSAEKKAMNLLEKYLDKDFKDVRISKSVEAGQLVDNIEKLFKEPEPPSFIMVMLDNFAKVSLEIEVWKSFFDNFSNQKFIIWSMEDEDAVADLFKSIDLGHNEIFVQKGGVAKELIYIFTRVKGVIVNNFWCEGLCNYMGVDFISFMVQSTKENPLPQYEYFKNRVPRILFHSVESIEYRFLGETIEWSSMNQVVDKIHFTFKL